MRRPARWDQTSCRCASFAPLVLRLLLRVAETGTLEIENLANRPGYSNGAKYYEDLEIEVKMQPRAAPQATQ